MAGAALPRIPGSHGNVLLGGSSGLYAAFLFVDLSRKNFAISPSSVVGSRSIKATSVLL
jgi:hypothetical protein